jgi:WD40 repeat protein
MIRRILAIAALLALTIGAAAQETTFLPLRTIATPFYGPVVELSPDGTLVAVHENQVLLASEVPVPVDLPILLFDLETGNEVGRLTGAQVDVARSVAFSPDGTQLASYHVNGDLIVWDIATQEATQVYDWLPMGGSFIDYLPDGQALTLVTYNGYLGQHVLFDLTSGSITDMLGLRPDTFAEFSDIAGVPLEMGIYSIAAQAVGPNGELYGASANGDVYRWDTETRLRELIYPASDERPMRYTVRTLQVLDDGSLAFLDSNLGEVVVFGPDGMRSQYPLNGQKFALSENGIAVSVDGREDALFWIDLNADPASAEPEQLNITAEGDDEGQPGNITGDVALAFTPEGDLIVGGLYASEGNSPIYIVDLP